SCASSSSTGSSPGEGASARRWPAGRAAIAARRSRMGPTGWFASTAPRASAPRRVERRAGPPRREVPGTSELGLRGAQAERGATYARWVDGALERALELADGAAERLGRPGRWRYPGPGT